jgi:hypothetical protein
MRVGGGGARARREAGGGARIGRRRGCKRPSCDGVTKKKTTLRSTPHPRLRRGPEARPSPAAPSHRISRMLSPRRTPRPLPWLAIPGEMEGSSYGVPKISALPANRQFLAADTEFWHPTAPRSGQPAGLRARTCSTGRASSAPAVRSRRLPRRGSRAAPESGGRRRSGSRR